MAAQEGAAPTLIFAVTVKSEVRITVTVPSPRLMEYSFEPSGVAASATGDDPTGTEPLITFCPIFSDCTAFKPLAATYTTPLATGSTNTGREPAGSSVTVASDPAR